jgi:hypothetical protein
MRFVKSNFVHMPNPSRKSRIVSLFGCILAKLLRLCNAHNGMLCCNVPSKMDVCVSVSRSRKSGVGSKRCTWILRSLR